MGKSLVYLFSLGIIDPLTIIRIANINPAIGTPVCCNGILVVSAFKVLVELLIAFPLLFALDELLLIH